MDDLPVGTREKILETACELFSTKGYQNSSVRDIASLAKVNVAAVNYHFGSKDNLLNEVLKKLRDDLDNKMMEIYKEVGSDFFKLSLKLFNLYLETDSNIIKLFMMALFERVIDFNHIVGEGGVFGPPGSNILYKSLKESFLEKKIILNEKSLSWGTKAMSLHIAGTSNFLRNYGAKFPHFCSEEIAENSIERLARSILIELETHH